MSVGGEGSSIIMRKRKQDQPTQFKIDVRRTDYNLDKVVGFIVFLSLIPKMSILQFEFFRCNSGKVELNVAKFRAIYASH